MNLKRVSRLLLIMVIAVGMIGSAMTPVTAASKPGKVKGVKVTMATNNYISLKWSKAEKEKKYEVQYKLSTSKKWKSKKTTKKKVKLTGLKSNKTYNIRVRALNGSKKGKFSKTKNQKTYIKPSEVNYRSIYATKRDYREIKLKWKAVSNASWYEIYTLELNSDGPADIQNCDYEEDAENEYRSLPEYTSSFLMRQNTWYEFKVRSVNAKTGKFPALKSAWTKPFYACTLEGDRIITGREQNGIIVYELNDTFVIGADDVFVPRKIYERADYVDEDYSEIWYENDVMYCNAVTFPENFTEIAKEMDNIGNPNEGVYPEDLLNGKTYTVGDEFKEEDGYQHIIQSIIVEPNTEDNGDFVVVLNMGGGYAPSFSW